MHYVFELKIPAKTAKADAVQTTCRLTAGVIHNVKVCFPPGPMALAHVVIYRFEHQVWPTNPEEDYAWDDFVIDFDEGFKLDTWPYTMSIRGWNEGDTEDHTVTVMFEVSIAEYTLADLLASRPLAGYLEG